jgi:hypothetical protein
MSPERPSDTGFRGFLFVEKLRKRVDIREESKIRLAAPAADQRTNDRPLGMLRRSPDDRGEFRVTGGNRLNAKGMMGVQGLPHRTGSGSVQSRYSVVAFTPLRMTFSKKATVSSQNE